MNSNNEYTNENDQGQSSLNQNQAQNSNGQVDTYTAKRLTVRQKLALALMAVGGALVVGLIWFSLYNQETIR